MVKTYQLDQIFINTSEAYSKCIYIGMNHVVVPYINIGLMPNNPINRKQSNVDYSYYVFKKVQSVFFNGRKSNLELECNYLVDKKYNAEYIIVGYENENSAEVKIICEERLFYLPDESNISDPSSAFYPIDTPFFDRNMDKHKTTSFFLSETFPVEITEILSKNFYKITLH